MAASRNCSAVDEALLTFQHALKLKPDHWDAAYRCGFLLREMGRPEEALPYFNLVDRLQPNQHVVLEMRAHRAAQPEKIRGGAGR